MNRIYIAHQSKLKRVINLLIAFGLIISFRYFYVQVLNANQYSSKIEQKTTYIKNIAGSRGNIFDRNGILLATNITKVDLWVNTKEYYDMDSILDFFYENFNLSKTDTKNLLIKEKANYVPIKKNIILPNLNQIKKQVIPIKGLKIDIHSQRFYPYGEVCSQLIGYVDHNGDGKAGVELKFDKVLKGKEKIERLDRAIGSKSKNKNKEQYNYTLNGSDIYLTIDIELQKILYEEIIQGQINSNAKSASGVIVNSFNGDVLAIAGSPSFDPNNYEKYSLDKYKNNAISNQYEPGSTIKVIPVLDTMGSVDFKNLESINCENGEYKISNTTRIIHDHEPHEGLSISEILIHSSNIGIAKMAEIIGPKDTYKSLRKFGIGAKTGIDLPGEARGSIRNLKSWSRLSHLMVSIGQEFSLTNIQLSMIYASIANGGYLLKPQIIKKIKSIDREENYTKIELIRKVMNTAESEQMIEILKKAVLEGTGRNAIIDEYPIAGKTGTAEKFINGTYSKDEFVSSFASLFPASDPVYTCIISVDSPEYNKHWGNITAAPIAKEIFLRIIKNNFLYKFNNKLT